MSKSKRYQLKDQETSFFDSETELSVTRKEVVEIDTSKGAGRATLRAIKHGGLIEVNRESKADEKEGSKVTGAKGKEEKKK